MDNEHSNASQSAAAVADGVSSETKSPNSTAYCAKNVNTSTMAGSLNGSSSTNKIKLLIKASSQQFEDITIESDLLWTVKNLKAHLSHVYPSKPAIDDQKLIYSGQLLKDNHQLKDIIRNYKDVYTHNHVIHLVCSIMNKPSTTTKVSLSQHERKFNNFTNGAVNDNLRQIHFGNTVMNENHTSPQPMCPPISGASNFMPFANNRSNPHVLSNQQIAMYNWLQQVYNQYMQQYLQRSNGTNVLELNASTSLSQDMSSAPPSSQQANTTPILRSIETSMYQVNEPVLPARPVQSAANVERAAPAPMAVAAQFPTFDQDDTNNNDWLDTLFCVIRFIIFFTIFYFNFAAMRCIVSFIIAISIYSYHIRLRREHNEDNNNNINRNNNTNAATVPTNTSTNNSNSLNQVGNNSNETVNENQNENRTSSVSEGGNENDTRTRSWICALAFVRTFIVSFFTSLLPEEPAI